MCARRGCSRVGPTRMGSGRIVRLSMDPAAEALTAAIEANIIQRVCDIASRSRHMELHDRPDTLWISSDIAHPYLNRVFRARFHARGVQEGTRHVLDKRCRWRCQGPTLPALWQ